MHRYLRKKLNNSKNSQQSTCINNVGKSETTEQSGSQNVILINYNEQYNFEYDSSDDNCVAMVEPPNSTKIALQNMTKEVAILTVICFRIAVVGVPL